MDNYLLCDLLNYSQSIHYCFMCVSLDNYLPIDHIMCSENTYLGKIVIYLDYCDNHYSTENSSVINNLVPKQYYWSFILSNLCFKIILPVNFKIDLNFMFPLIISLWILLWFIIYDHLHFNYYHFTSKLSPIVLFHCLFYQMLSSMVVFYQD